MTSAGDRRWVSTRRAGMTVLGKVAVPKPINLPSQRLENHGLDPNVEIVPKGTHSWGGRPTSSTSNAWGSSTLSPKTNGGTASPSHRNGRPSSGGSGTRPSTAGSDRAREPTVGVWASNSRPSSASGSLTSSQTSHTSLRPRSAETRPGSSQLSRFAEPLSDTSSTWSTTGAAEKLGVLSSNNDGFSLTSGDFPTLGSEKETSGKNAETQEHGSHSHPSSSSDGLVGKERPANSVGDISLHENEKIETSSSWRRDNPLYGEEGPRPSVEKWHADPQLYPNSTIPPQHYDAWRGPPMNNHPGAVWYRGPPGGPPRGPPFGSPVPPGGFPMEPFPFYRPQFPPVLANPQPVPPGAGPRGPHPKNGDMYRPPMHDAYMRPNMPVRPGFYPGPVSYETYYGPPPTGYCNSNERDIPFMGMPMGPHAYNRFPGQPVPDPGNSQDRSGGYGPSSKSVVSEQMESGHSQDARGPYRVLLKQHDSWDGMDEEQTWNDNMTSNASYPRKGDNPRKSYGESGWRTQGKDDEMDTSRTEVSEDEALKNHGTVLMKVKPSESVKNCKVSCGSPDQKLDRAEQLGSSVQNISSVPKDPSLIQKIESLNAKARASEAHDDDKSFPSMSEQKNKTQVSNAKANNFSDKPVTGSVVLEQAHAGGTIKTVYHEFAADRSVGTTVASGPTNSRRSTHGMRGRVDHPSKGRVSNQDADGWQRKSQIGDTPNVAPSVHIESSVVQGKDHSSGQAAEKSASNQLGKDDEESNQPAPYLSDTHAQRAKMRELAMQRIKQREKEEEERTRDQKARALAKLEELNKNSQKAENPVQKLEIVPNSAIDNKQEEALPVAQSAQANSSTRARSTDLDSNKKAVMHSSESNVKKVEVSSSSSTGMPPGTRNTAHKESAVMHQQLQPLKQDVDVAAAAHRSNSPRFHDSNASKNKRMGYRQKQNGSSEKNSNEIPISSSTTEASRSHAEAAENAALSLEGVGNEISSNCDSSLPINPSIPPESTGHHKKKNRSGRNKHKVEDLTSTTALPSLLSSDAIASGNLVESGESKTSNPVLEPHSAQSLTDSGNANQLPEQHTSLSNQEGLTKVNYNVKSHNSRRIPRNTQANKPGDKFHGTEAVWAPVQSQNKIEVSDEADHKTVVDAVPSFTRSDQLVHNSQRNRRAEIERYIPKPVAKEMAQQGSSQQPVASSVNQVISEEPVGRSESGSASSQTSGTASGKVGSVIESKNGDGRPNRSGKVQGSWRQRVSGESSISDSNQLRNVPKSVDHQSQKPDSNLGTGQSRYSDDWNDSGSWNGCENSDAPPISVPAVRDQGVTTRGKRQPYKGHRGTVYNHDQFEKRVNSGDAENVHTHSHFPDKHPVDLPASSKENRGGERAMSHWQPKSQPFSAGNQSGSRPNSGQNVHPEGSRANKRDFTPQGGVLLPPQEDKETAEHRVQPHHYQAFPEKNNAEEAPFVGNVGHQESKRGRKVSSYKGRPGSPGEISSSNLDSHYEHRGSSGFRKNGNQNNRFSREYESHGDWDGYGKDNKQHNVHVNRERPRHSSHSQYQPVGSHNDNKPSNFEPLKDGSTNSNSRFRERGSHSRRGGGNFHGRHPSSIVVDASGN